MVVMPPLHGLLFHRRVQGTKVSPLRGGILRDPAGRVFSSWSTLDDWFWASMCWCFMRG